MTVFGIAPVLLKNEGRIEDLPLYPEERRSRRPTAEQVLRLFSSIERYKIFRRDALVQVCEPELTGFQKQVLKLLGVPLEKYRN
jgi:hypothetical protein